MRLFSLLISACIYLALVAEETRRVLLSSSSNEQNELYVGRLDEFSKSGVIALHFPCTESNMFSTNCACHIKCTNTKCDNAIDICRKYRSSHSCQFVLLRGGKMNKFATLKRSPSEAESRRFSVSEFSSPEASLMSSRPSPTIRQLVSEDSSANEMLMCIRDLVQRGLPQPHCGFRNRTVTEYLDSEFLGGGITLVALSYRSPLTLANSMRSWNASGLLDLVQFRTALLSKPTNEEIHMSTSFGFDVVQPQSIPGSEQVKPNVFTIGAAFYYGLSQAKSEYVLFLENDFKIDTSLSKSVILRELVAAAAMLRGGAEVVRLLSRKAKGCGTFKDCDHGGIHLDAADPLERTRNWFAFYCPERAGTERLVSDCLKGNGASSIPAYRCFSSWDSNWSLNAVLVKRSSMLTKKYPTAGGSRSIAEVGLSHAHQQDGFETDMMYSSKWMHWRVPICISLEGMFTHEEIETSA